MLTQSPQSGRSRPVTKTTTTTMTTTTMTTDRGPVTARARILGWILLVVTLTVTAIVVATGRAELARIESTANTELAHEAAKFREFATKPDPSTGGEFASVDALLTAFIQYNAPEQWETFFSVVDGRAVRRSPGEPLIRLDQDRSFVAQVAAAGVPAQGRLDTSQGVVVYAVIPARVAGDGRSGQLVVVEFLGPARAQAWSTIGRMSAFAGITVVLVALTGWFVASRTLAPVRELSQAAAQITATDLGRRIDVVGDDDIARMAMTFNGMLDRLEGAFDAQRQFLDDAGHELRTPITVVRGHLELMGDDPEERRQTLALVDDELRRMSRLVDDLIVLARSERPDFLRPEPTDLADLVVETFAKATALGERRWLIDQTPEGVAVLDGQRLTQALLQLAANAVAHTQPGDTVALGGAVKGQRLELWVRDGGVGIEPADQAGIFERFARGRDAAGNGRGSGLGLAIVAGIVAAHGGTASVASEPGRGSVFTLDLPLHPPREDG